MSMILVYHSISPTVQEGDLQVHPETLRRHIQWLRAQGCQYLPLKQLCDRAIDCDEPDTRSFALSFDDAYEDVLKYAVPVLLDEQAMGATVFACPGLVGMTNQWSRYRGLGLRHMTADQLNELRSEGLSVEPHGWNHQRFTELGSAELTRQLRRCRVWWQDVLCDTPQMVAYPYGEFDDQVKSVVQHEFRYGLACEQGHGLTDAFAVSRVSVADRTRLSTLWKHCTMGDPSGPDNKR